MTRVLADEVLAGVGVGVALALTDDVETPLTDEDVGAAIALTRSAETTNTLENILGRSKLDVETGSERRCSEWIVSCEDDENKCAIKQLIYSEHAVNMFNLKSKQGLDGDSDGEV